MANNFSVATYSPTDVALIIGGYTLSGWDRISIARRTDSFKPIFGIRGKHTRIRMGGKEARETSAFITITLSQESQANDVLSEIHRQDIDEGTARIALILKDSSGSSVFSSNEAYITNFAAAEFSNDFGTREWRMFAQTTETYNIGNNTRPSTSLVDSVLDSVSSLFS